MPLGQSQDIFQAHPGGRVTPPVSTSSNPLSTLHRRFACARLKFCPRDSMLVIGDEIIETPMVWPCRYFETHSSRKSAISRLMFGCTRTRRGEGAGIVVRKDGHSGPDALERGGESPC